MELLPKQVLQVAIQLQLALIHLLLSVGQLLKLPLPPTQQLARVLHL